MVEPLCAAQRYVREPFIIDASSLEYWVPFTGFCQLEGQKWHLTALNFGPQLLVSFVTSLPVSSVMSLNTLAISIFSHRMARNFVVQLAFYFQNSITVFLPC